MRRSVFSSGRSLRIEALELRTVLSATLPVAVVPIYVAPPVTSDPSVLVASPTSPSSQTVVNHSCSCPTLRPNPLLHPSPITPSQNNGHCGNTPPCPDPKPIVGHPGCVDPAHRGDHVVDRCRKPDPHKPVDPHGKHCGLLDHSHHKVVIILHKPCDPHHAKQPVCGRSDHIVSRSKPSDPHRCENHGQSGQSDKHAKDDHGHCPPLHQPGKTADNHDGCKHVTPPAPGPKPQNGNCGCHRV